MDILCIFLLLLLSTFSSIQAAPTNSKLFREYIGAEGKGVKFSDVPINPDVEFHFILSFAIDYTSSPHPSPTNGYFQAYWDTENLSPSFVSSIRAEHPNVRIGMSLGGDTINKEFVYFKPTSITTWVANAIHSIREIAETYKLDGIDIDYEHFSTDPDTFAECIGRLLFHLKQMNIVSFASIAPYDNSTVQEHYLTLWRKFGHLIDYVNFQFYAYDKGTTVSQFLEHFVTQNHYYKGGNILVSFGTNGSGGLSSQKAFFSACSTLSRWNKLHGIFVWSADDSKEARFQFEQHAQSFLANNTK